MQKTKKVGLGQNNPKSKLFYALMALIPSLQFLIFYVVVNINSFSLAFKEFLFDSEGAVTGYKLGLINFEEWFTNQKLNTELVSAIQISLKSYGISLCTGLPLGLFFSYYMFKKMPGAKMFRVLLFMPSILSAAVLGVIFKNVTALVIDGSDGILLNWLKLEEDIGFWSKDNRYGTMMFFCIFISFGSSVLMYTNKMDAIAPELIESANLDGASGIKEFWYIVLPHTFSIVQVFLMTGFAGLFTNQYNYMILFNYKQHKDAKPLGYVLWRGVYNAGVQHTALVKFAALGLMITVVVVPLTLFLRWAINKIGWKEE